MAVGPHELLAGFVHALEEELLGNTSSGKFCGGAVALMYVLHQPTKVPALGMVHMSCKQGGQMNGLNKKRAPFS